MTSQITKVRYKNQQYGVMCIDYNDTDVPVVLDWEDALIVQKICKKWTCASNGFVSCSHTYDSKTKEVFLHDLVMSVKMKANGAKRKNVKILHINKIGLDNRRDNLMYNDKNKPTNMNIKKKSRIIELPDDIDPDTLPTYVWYMKPNGLHGERFIVKIGDVSWKTTSSHKKDVHYKLEEAKLFLRQLKEKRPQLFEQYSMNGDYTLDGDKLARSFHDIVKRAGYNHLHDYVKRNNTVTVIKAGLLPKASKQLLAKQGDLTVKGGQRRRCVSNLPDNCGVEPCDMPKHCYFKPEYNDRGAHFYILNHPNMQNKLWQTTTSKSVSILDKFNELLQHLKTVE